MSNPKKIMPGCLGYIRRFYYPVMWGLLINHYKDPNQYCMESKSKSVFFFRGPCVELKLIIEL